MSFSSIAKSYLRELHNQLQQAAATGEFTPELSYRPATDTFLRAVCELICPDAKVVFEPKNQARVGRPDWRIFNAKSYGVYGYIEGKAIDCEKELRQEHHAEQLDRYLGLGTKVILTDGLDFIFYRPGSSKPVLVSIVKKPISELKLSSATPNSGLEYSFRQFLEEPSFRIASEKSLIGEAALRARRLSEEIRNFVEIPLLSGLSEEENSTIQALHDLKSVLESHHDQTLNSSQAFADFIAQVLVFGLLYAHRVVSKSSDTPKSRDVKISDFWTGIVYASQSSKLKPFAALVTMLGSELKSLGSLGAWYTDCRLMLAHTNLNLQEGEGPDFHQLYERFLEAFDKKAKFDYGAFYTPRPLAEYALRLSEAALRREFPKRSLYESANKLIDPCCGTGTYVELLVRSACEARTSPHIAGFEILPAPYALAHYRLTMLKVSRAALHKTSIILTNTLSDALEKGGNQSEWNEATRIIANEQERARKLSTPPLMLIIGNPPSSDSPRRADAKYFTVIDCLIDDFRPPENLRHSRQNIQKQTQNEFIFFLRWACHKLERSSGLGVLSFVLPASFLENSSYIPARQWLLNLFDALWILEIDADLRAKVKDENIFNTQQGRCLLVGVRKPKSTKSRDPGKVSFASITSTPKSSKIDFLGDTKIPVHMLEPYVGINVTGPDFVFRPGGGLNRDLYNLYWPLCSDNNNSVSEESFIFARHCSGLKLAPSNLLVHPTKPLLLRRSREIADTSKDYDTIREQWFVGQQKPPSRDKISESVRKALSMALTDTHAVHTYSYRPFLQMYALLTPEVLHALSKTKGGGTRARPEVLSAFKNKKVVGIAIAPSPKELSGSLTPFASFCWGVPDNDLSRRGNAHIFCNFFPEYKSKRKDWKGDVNTNINAGLIKSLGIKGSKSLAPETAMSFYCYAVLCSTWYLNRFKSELFKVTSWPRIPIATNIATFKAVVDFGKRLAELEDFSIEVQVGKRYGSLLNNWSAMKLMGYDILPEKEQILLKGEDGKLRDIDGIEKEVAEFSVGGYQVLREWLKFHSQPYLRSTFKKEQLLELLSTCARIRKHIDISVQVDEVLLSFAENPNGLLVPGK